MNLFVISHNPRQCARYLDNRRQTKMTLETAQLLCNAIHSHCSVTKHEYTPIKYQKNKIIRGNKIKYKYYFNGVELYSPTHSNHPVSIWARKNKGNFTWLVRYFYHMCNEFSNRSGKRHGSQRLLKVFLSATNNMPLGDRTEFANCARNKEKGFDFTDTENVFEAYTNYLEARFNGDGKFAFSTWVR